MKTHSMRMGQGSREESDEGGHLAGAGGVAGAASAGLKTEPSSGDAEEDGGTPPPGSQQGGEGAKEGGMAGEKSGEDATKEASDSLAAEGRDSRGGTGHGGESEKGMGGGDGVQTERKSRGQGDVGDEGVKRGGEGAKKNLAMNATVEDTEGGEVARASWHSSKRGPQGATEAQAGGSVKAGAPDHAETGKELTEMHTSEDGSVPFYFLDAHEEAYGQLQGTVFLFGKVPQGNSYVSCCVMVNEMQRSLFVIPKPGTFSHSELDELEEKAEGGGEEDRKKLMTTLHTLAGPVKGEVADLLMDNGVNAFSMVPVRRSYAFENPHIPRGTGYCLKLKYPYKSPALPYGVSGDTFTTILGTHTRYAAAHSGTLVLVESH